MSEATKLCKGCGRVRPTRHFHKDRRTKDGLYGKCKQCRRPIQAAVRRRRLAEATAYRAAYRAEFPGIERERKRLARAAMTPEERRELWRYEYHQRDKAAIAKRVRERRHADDRDSRERSAA
jgi:hypothetical protein